MPVIDARDAARQRRVSKSKAATARVDWFIDNVANKVKMTMQQRVRLASAFLRDRVVINLSTPVRKIRSKLGRVWVDPASRSKPGEFPRADTTLLMKSIFSHTEESASGVYEGWVGTPIFYGLILELKMGRSFLLRTFNEEHNKLMAILNGPIA